MPKILVFAPCEKVIVSEQDNTSSLMSLIEGFTLDVPEGVELPEGTAIPIKWHIFSLWEKVEGDEGRNFEQRVTLVLPTGKQVLDMPSTLDFKPHLKRFRMTIMVVNFPLSPAGTCLLNLSVREVGQENWQEVAEYGIFITRPERAREGTAANEETRPETGEAGEVG